MKSSIPILSVFLIVANNLFAQNDSIVIKYLEKIIPYDSLQAIDDLNNDSIFILDLCGFDVFYESLNINEEREYVENRFGFKFKHDYFEVPTEFVLKKQDEYNRQVYKYLDSVLQIDSEEEINTELIRLGLERFIIANQTDESIKRYIKKEFRKENKIFKNKLIEADKIYRDRKFEIALKKYQELKNQAQTEKGLLYIQTSEYHCLMNLEKFNEAQLLTKYEINRKTKRIKH
ncbi:hypothetical protein ACE01N_12755 [Saccharicrinis sp. FJH2]|uniref:hypothetical protein n=1 Tax=Saccharicrinis sp. FJH65 TaxID=3344659 RepID=UPI0035F4F780